ncbi:uncharacterized protein [Diadema antillarum]|uniref:uncharacterized protein n=1 Tax=Diadema antillarum TaxID=105358 RepID=UPI003A849E46
MISLLCRRYIASIRLMRAGDIESNPGPNDESIRHERMFLDLSANIPPSSFDLFGNSLGFGHSELSAVMERRHLDSKGALMDILCKWRDRQPPGTDIIRVLTEKLRQSDLGSFTEITADYSQLPGSSTNPSSLKEDQVVRIKEGLKEYYRLLRRRVNVDPLNFKDNIDLDDIYTTLSLADQSGRKTRTVTYEDLVTRDKERCISKRILIQGEGGAGKTTLCSKIALDWCNDKILQDMNMVVVVPLRHVSDDATIGSIVKTFVDDQSVGTEKQINDYISSNQQKILLVFDGFDEYGAKMEKNRSREIIRILGVEQYKLCKVIVTTRPWTNDEFKESRLALAYTFISVEGFNKDNLQLYIKRYFQIEGKDALAEDLINFIDDNDFLRSNMTPFPIYCAMLCLIWNFEREKTRKKLLKLQTFSQIFEHMISFLKVHYASKASENLKNQATADNLMEVNRAIEDIGEIALEGLLNRTFSFPEELFNKCKNSMDICCRVGILTKEAHTITWESVREGKITHFVGSTVSFPHKLFQEYIAGECLVNLFANDRSTYNILKGKLRINSFEFRYLLYFSSYLKTELGLDIINVLVHANKDLCVDVAFECHTIEATKIVGKQWKEYELFNATSDHTKSGVSFMVQCNQVHSLVIEEVQCGRTVSQELAEAMCSSCSLRSVRIQESTFHDDFYRILAAKASKSQIQNLEISSIHSFCIHQHQPSIGRNLAQWVCTMPHLSRFSVSFEYLTEEFASTAVASTSPCQIKELMLSGIKVYRDRISVPSLKGNLAPWVCTMPHLSRISINCVYLPDEFCPTVATSPSSCRIRELTFSNFEVEDDVLYQNLIERDLIPWIRTVLRLSQFSVRFDFLTSEFLPSAAASDMVESCHVNNIVLTSQENNGHQFNSSLKFFLGREHGCWVSALPCLSSFSIDYIFLTSEFLSAAVSFATSCQIQDLVLTHGGRLALEFSMGSDLAQWVCYMPRLSKFKVDCIFLSTEFPTVAAALASKCQIQDLVLSHSHNGRHCPFKIDGSNLGRWVCHMPRLSKFKVDCTFLTDTFHPTAAVFASRCQIQELVLTHSENTHCPFNSIFGEKFGAWVCHMPRLSKLKVDSLCFFLSDGFLSAAAELASSCQIQDLVLTQSENNKHCPFNSIFGRNFGVWLCHMPRLSKVKVDCIFLSDRFLSAAAALASSCQIRELDLNFVLVSDPGGEDLARFLCHMPHLVRVDLKCSEYLPEAFFTTLASQATSSMIQNITINGKSSNEFLSDTQRSMRQMAPRPRSNLLPGRRIRSRATVPAPR